MTSINLPTVPVSLSWSIEPVAWHLDDTQTLHITAGPETDLFIDPQGTNEKLNAPRLMFQPDSEFTLSARVTVDFGSTFDAGVLCLYASDICWAKLCFEYSPQQQPMIVSVVTNTRSDDCNSVTLTTNTTYLRVTKIGPAFAFHYSLDGTYWQLVRYFTLTHPHAVQVGFIAQSPTGSQCTAAFSEIHYVTHPIQDIRSGQ
jgi:uncharacterized protein